MILDYCHNCGSKEKHLNVVGVVEDGECDAMSRDHRNKHHIHVYAACDDCKKKIWDISNEEVMKKQSIWITD